MGAREAQVEKYLDTEVKKLGGITRKWVSPGRIGVPDRIVIIEGRVYFVEVKTVTGELSVYQERERQRLADAGARCFVVYGTDGVDDFIRTIEAEL